MPTILASTLTLFMLWNTPNTFYLSVYNIPLVANGSSGATSDTTHLRILFWHELEKCIVLFSLKPLKPYTFEMAQSQINNKLRRNASWCLLSVLKITIVFILIGSFGLWKENIFEKDDWNVKRSFISLKFVHLVQVFGLELMDHLPV